jgi:hypothetical protein
MGFYSAIVAATLSRLPKEQKQQPLSQEASLRRW